MTFEHDTTQPRAVVWIVDDVRQESASLTRSLSADFTLEIFEDGARMIERLKSAPPPDVLVIEPSRSGSSVLEICRALRARAATAALPVLVLTVPLDDEALVRALAAGVDDHVIKPVSLALLTARIVSLVRVGRLRARADRAENEARIARERLDASTDPRSDVARLAVRGAGDPAGARAGEMPSPRDEADWLRLVEQLRHRTQLLAVGNDLGAALIQRGSLRQALQSSAQVLVDHLDAAFARVWTLDEGANVLELQASAGLYTHLDGAHGRVPVGQFKIGTIAATRKPHLTNAVQGDPLVPEQEWARREGLVAFAGYPLIVDDQLVGVLALFARRSLGEDTLAVLASAARSLGVAIARAGRGGVAAEPGLARDDAGERR